MPIRRKIDLYVNGMQKKIFITSKNTATFICPKCQRAKTVDVSKYAHLYKTVEIIVLCLCGHRFTCILERRKKYRKQADLAGGFVHLAQGKEVNRGPMTVCDLSTTGIKLKVNEGHNFSVGDLLQVWFHLDDAHRTLINKEVIIRNINIPFIGTEFSSMQSIDKALGFYLLK